MSGKHQAIEFNRYIELHRINMDRLRDEGFVVDDTLEIDGVGSEVMSIKGCISCLGGLDIDVEKYLNVTKHDGELSVQTFKYTYAAHVAGVCGVFRYCGPHGHRPYHHRHTFDVFGTHKEDKSKIRQLSEDEWPTLGQAVEELRDWYHENIAGLEVLSRTRRRRRATSRPEK